MNKIVAAVLLPLLVNGGPDMYGGAYREAADGVKPIVIVYSASWCAPCQRLRMQLAQLLDCNVVEFDIDRDAAFIRKHKRGTSVPRIHVFFKGTNGWRTRKLIGYHDAAAIQAVVNEVKQ